MSARSMIGVVSSVRSENTVGVLIERIVKHPRYHKRVKVNASYLVHDPNLLCAAGDVVVIEECRPVSKLKSWVVNKVLEKKDGSVKN